MKKFEMDCWEVVSIDGEGKGTKHMCYVSTWELANAIVTRGGGYRDAYPHRETITIFDSLSEMADAEKHALIKSALAKLSAAEKKALGVQND